MEATGEYMSQDVRKTGRRGVPRLPVFLTDWHMESQAPERRSDCPLSLPRTPDLPPHSNFTYSSLNPSPTTSLDSIMTRNAFLSISIESGLLFLGMFYKLTY